MTNETKEKFLNGGDLARLCQADIKTIHNWVKKGAIRSFRTPGRHLRFERAEVRRFLAAHGYPIPEALEAPAPEVAA